MAYNKLPLWERAFQAVIFTYAAGLLLGGVMQGGRAIDDWNRLSDDRVAATYYDSRPDTTPAMVADVQQVLTEDESTLWTDAVSGGLLIFAGGVMSVYSYYLTAADNRPDSQPAVDTTPEQAQ